MSTTKPNLVAICSNTLLLTNMLKKAVASLYPDCNLLINCEPAELPEMTLHLAPDLLIVDSTAITDKLSIVDLAKLLPARLPTVFLYAAAGQELNYLEQFPSFYPLAKPFIIPTFRETLTTALETGRLLELACGSLTVA